MIETLLTHNRVRSACSHIEHNDERTLVRQAALSAIPAPTGAEAARAACVAEMLADAGLADVTIDGVGNVLGWDHDGKRETGNGCVVLSAHLDTVFGPELDVSVRRQALRLEGPGIADNARGLAALVSVADAWKRADVRAARPVLFGATVGEEGHGDLRGVRHLLDNGVRAQHAAPLHASLRPAAFIALDGAGIERIVHHALGAIRYRATYRGPGGHSWTAFGVANPANAVGRAAAALADLPGLRQRPRSTCAVVRLGGGTSLNSIPQEAWLDLDLRSEDPRALARLDAAVRAALRDGLEAENRRRAPGTLPLSLEIRRLGERPSGVTPRAHPLVRGAVAATHALGQPSQLACASTDANAPIALGVPAIALGAGGRAGDTHLPTEWYENTGGALGIVRALLVTALAAEVR